MEQKKSMMESLTYNLVMILCFTILFLIFRSITYIVLTNLNKIARLNWTGQYFYMSLLEVVVLLLIFKFGLNKENKIIKADEKKIKINIFDILIFLFIGLLLKNILYEGLLYLEDITNTSPNYRNIYGRNLIDTMQATNLDNIYINISAVILGPIVEELFFRKGVFEYFADKGVTNRTVILISGISFGLIHSIGPAIVVHSIITGIIFATIYATTRNIIYPIIGHGLNNLMSGIKGIFGDTGGIEDIKAGITIEIRSAIIVCLILLIITSILSYIKRKTIISLDFKKRLVEVFTK